LQNKLQSSNLTSNNKILIDKNNPYSSIIANKEQIKLQFELFLEKKIRKTTGKIHNFEQSQIKSISEKTILNIVSWICDEIPNNYKNSILESLLDEQWDVLLEAFSDNLSFGSGGIRGKLAIPKNVIISKTYLQQLENDISNDTFLTGSNNCNEILVMKYTEALFRYMKKNNFNKILVGYDNRFKSKSFSELVCNEFLSKGFSVYAFDDIIPLPTLALTMIHEKIPVAVEITASHNDKRHNGYKILVDGMPLSFDDKTFISNQIFGNNEHGINPIQIKDIQKTTLAKSNNNNLVYFQNSLIPLNNSNFDVFGNHIDNLKDFVINSKLLEKYSSELNVGYCSLYGAGYKLIPRVLKTFGVKKIKELSEMNKPDPFFPLFEDEQMLDPGEESCAKIIVEQFIAQYGENEFKNLDCLLTTDPDSDRLSLIINTTNPSNSDKIWELIKGDDLWTLILWYLLQNLPIMSDNKKNQFFIVKNYVTSDVLLAISKKFGIQCFDTWVGFGELAKNVREKWKEGKINLGMFEESNGFSIGGHPNIKSGINWIKFHLLEKDAALTTILLIELFAYCKSKNLSILELLHKIFLDPEIGLYLTQRSQIPEYGTFEGVTGEIQKQIIVKSLEELVDTINNRENKSNPFMLNSIQITHAEKYCTGKYDEKFWENFPDEGIRLFMKSIDSHITIRPSGTESKIRIFVQQKMVDVQNSNIQDKSLEGNKLLNEISNQIKLYINNLLI